MSAMTQRLALAATLLALCVVVLGAYVRLSDAGLGCPDWPGCYGKLSPAHASPEIHAALAADPNGPVTPAKAWKEMIHRYLASTLGVLIVVLAVRAWSLREAVRAPVAGLLALVILQGMLGRWTVTLLLKPVVVSAHLLGGMALLALLAWIALHALAPRIIGDANLRRLAAFALMVLIVQIALGGWVSSNAAALVCPDLPTCRGAWWPAADFARGFAVLRDPSVGGDGNGLSIEALTAVQLAHRIGAALLTTILLWLVSRMLMAPGLRRLAWTLLGLILLQVGFGLANVILVLPLPVAVAHSAGAALLLVALVWLNLRLHAGDRR